ncbi:TIR-like protein FxsC [Streptomyces pseudovenezuelae]|uniref:FxsC-like protein n=1 Tax=Streptomyces pseudovenezuelae TaxID=67350 RepID=A0ABT6LI81_9ACTN|nr:TIR-like protein FxsC [Streptomyces pseudovenezuelae]MDH6215494.1 FxsC-like protein [Streptomyces pseudovenezuelae]
MDTPAQDNRPHFFLSYAHTPAWGAGSGDADQWVRTLFADLCDHVMALTDLPRGTQVGFMDHEMRTGEGWPEVLSRNLATCRVFVPLYSPRYFTSEHCGREWYAFNERVLQARTSGSDAVPAIVPALGTHMDLAGLPDSAKRIHIDLTSADGHYESKGLYGLGTLRRLRDEYQETVFALAQRIVRVAEETNLPPSRPRAYDRTRSAFKPRGEAPRRIHLTVAAPTLETIPAHRDARFYGDDPHDWNPYHAESMRSLSQLAEDLIRSLDYHITVSAFEDELTGPAAEDDEHTDTDPAGAGRPPSILLIDRWVLTDEEYRRRLTAYDAYAHPWVTAVVPWNRGDEQCQGPEGKELAAQLESTLPSILAGGRRLESHTTVNGVPTLKAFNDLLPTVVAHATRQFLKRAEPHLPTGRTVVRPRIEGPVPQSSPAADPDHGTDHGEAK